MTRIRRDPDRGHSPRHLLARQLTLALATGNGAAVSRCVTDDVEWVIVGHGVITGKVALLAELARAARRPPAEVTLGHVVCQGRAAAVDGTIRLASGKLRAFCDMIDFATARGTVARRVTSYDVPL